MTFTRIIVLSVIFAAGGFAPTYAQSVEIAVSPAEAPPSSFTANQYVDSRGCVFIRAGVDGKTTWVPRVSRDRKPVCGFQPSLGAQEAAAASVAPVPPRSNPVAITTEPQPTPSTTSAPRPDPAATPKPAPTPQATASTAPVVAVQTSAPRVVAAPAPAPSPGPEPTVYKNPQPGTAPAAILVPASTEKAGTPVQQTVRSSPVRRTRASSPAASKPVRIVPRHVFDNRQNTLVRADPPAGYKPAWDDDRLNPNRAERTFAVADTTRPAKVPSGYKPAWDDDRLNRSRGFGTAAGTAQTDALWTQKVPRTLEKVPTEGVVVSIRYRKVRSPAPASSAPRVSSRSAEK